MCAPQNLGLHDPISQVFVAAVRLDGVSFGLLPPQPVNA